MSAPKERNAAPPICLDEPRDNAAVPDAEEAPRAYDDTGNAPLLPQHFLGQNFALDIVVQTIRRVAVRFAYVQAVAFSCVNARRRDKDQALYFILFAGANDPLRAAHIGLHKVGALAPDRRERPRVNHKVHALCRRRDVLLPAEVPDK